MNRPVLILGFMPRIVLPIARSLQRHKVPVDVASFQSASRIPSSAISESRNIPRPDVDRREFVKQLRGFIQERGHDMLIPADDWMLTAVVEHYDDLADLLQVGCPPPAITRLVLEKSSTLAIAQRCGIEVPRTVLITNSSQLHDLVGSLSFPWVLKPSQRETRTEEMKSCSFRTAEEVAKKFPPGHQFTPPMLVQEYCAGDGVGVEMLLHHGQCMAMFQHRRLKEFPYTGGASVIAVAEEPNPSLTQSSLALLQALQWQGVAMVEYKIGPDGRAVLMEVNGRYWGTIALPISAGIDFPLYHWKLAHGERPEIPKTYAVGTKWRWTVGYLHRLYDLLDLGRRSTTARAVLSGDIRHLLEDFSASIPDAIMKRSDPMPSLVDFLLAIRDFASYTAARALQSQAFSRRFRPLTRAKYPQQQRRTAQR
jgi:predicted ATP-grasp superfamily ATP-dependent carboligase